MNSKTFLIIIVFLLLGIAGYSQVINLDATTTGSTITTCSATLYDSGGPDGNYSASENYTITFCSDNGGFIVVDVLSLNTEPTTDYLKLYDGNSTNASIIATLSGQMPEQTEYMATGSCITIQWHSDGSVQYPGFGLSIRCGLACQAYTARIILDAQYDATNDIYHGCIGSMVSAQIDFPNNNVEYEQTIDNTTFSWRVVKNNETTTYSGLGLNELDETLVSGAYSIMLTTSDINSCRQNDEIVTYISMPPTFNVTSMSSPVCPGTNFELHGSVVPPDPWYQNFSATNDEQHCFDDSHGDLIQTNCFYLTDFSVGRTITSGSDIESIGMNMEHSYMGDLDIYLRCPNGQQVELFHQSCGGAFYGEPVDTDDLGTNSCNDGDEYVGIGYDYYWTEGANNGRMADNCPGQGNSLPSGYYQPDGNFSDLIGCPLNGEWCVIFVDNMASDDGVLFHTEINFADYLTQESVLYQNTYGNEMWWEGDGVQTAGFATDNTAIPTIPGSSAYTFHATDNFGCTYDTTLYVTVYEAPIANIAEDDYAICGYTGQLSVDFNGIGEGIWETNAPAGMVSIDNASSPTINISTTELNTGNAEHPYYEFYWTAQNDNLCTDSDTVRVRFVRTPTANFNMNIGDTVVCGNTFEHLQAEDLEESYLGVWYDVNTSTLFGEDNALVGSPSSSATVEDYGRHDFYWIVYNEYVTDPNVCRDTAGPWTVNFIQRPNAQIAEDDLYICGYSGQLTAGYDIGEGIWSTSTGLVSFDNASSPTTNVSTTELNTGNAEHPYYQLYWTVRNTELCTDVDSIRVMFVSAPTANFNMNIGDTIACGNTFEHLQAEELGDSFAGYWYEANSSTQFGDDNSLFTSASTIATVEDYGRHDFYWIVYNELVDNPNSCRDTAGPWTVNFIQPPTAHITENEFVFCGNSGQLTADYDSIYGGMWASNASSLVSFDNASSSTTTVSTTELNTGNTEHPYYMLYWTVQNTEFCANTDSARVIFKRKPSSEFSVIPPKCFGESAIILAAEDSLPLYNWDFDNGLTTSITANAASGYYKALIFWDNQEQSHTVVLSTTDSYGCHSDITQITIDEPYRPEYSYIIYGDTCAMGKGGIELTDETGYYTFFWLDNSENSANATGYDHETGVITDSHVYNLPAGTYTYHTQYQTFNSDYTQSYQQYFHDINCHSYPEIEISVIGKIMAGIALSEDIDIGSIATPNADVVFVNTTDYDSIYNTICDWNFGDGSTVSTCDELVEHTYLEPCRYFPYLVVQNRDLPECRDTAFFELAVNKRIDTVVNTSYFEYEWHTYYVSGEYLINMHSDNGCTYILILNITLPNDVAEYEKYGIDIYPNPTENFLRIISQMKMSAVEIISATGQLVMSSETNDSYVDFDVSSLNDGVYFVRIYGEDNVAPIVQKFIKE